MNDESKSIINDQIQKGLSFLWVFLGFLFGIAISIIFIIVNNKGDVIAWLINLICIILFVRWGIIEYKRNKKVRSIFVGTMISVIFLIVLYYFGWPLLQRHLVNQACKNTYGSEWKAVKYSELPSEYNDEQCCVINWYCYNKKTGEAHNVAE